MAATDLKAMLAFDVKERPLKVPTEPGWIIEPKLDGWRILWERTADGVRVYGGRNGTDSTDRPGAQAIREALMFLPVGTVLDSELVAEGHPSPMVSTALANPRAARLRAYVFDVLADGDGDVCALPWRERRARLERLAEGFDREQVCLMPYSAPRQDLHEAWAATPFVEGSVAKRMAAPYEQGKRPRDGFRKLKERFTADAEIIGFENGKGAGNGGEIGAFNLRLLDTGALTSVAPSPALAAQAKADPDAFLGHICEVTHYGWQRSNGEPECVRHPVSPRMRPDRDAA